MHLHHRGPPVTPASYSIRGVEEGLSLPVKAAVSGPVQSNARRLLFFGGVEIRLGFFVTPGWDHSSISLAGLLPRPVVSLLVV